MRLRFLSWFGALALLAEAACAGSAQRGQVAVLAGTVTDATGAVIRGATAHIEANDNAPGTPQPADETSDTAGAFSFAVPPGTYLLQVDAEGFARFSSKPLSVKPGVRLHLPVHLVIASMHEEISVLADEASDPSDLASAVVFEGKQLNLLSDDTVTMRQQLMSLGGGPGTQFVVDGFSGGRLPPKSSIRSIRINANRFSAAFAEYGGRVEISTKPGTDKLHGAVTLSGTDQPWDARNPYTTVKSPFFDFQQEGNLTGPLNKRTSFFVSDSVEQLANNAVVNASDPLAPAMLISSAVPSPQSTQTYSLRLDRQVGASNYAYVREEWSGTRVSNSGIVPLLLPEAAFALNTLTNTLQVADTQTMGPHGLNEARFQYLRTRVRQEPKSALPSVVVESAFQSGGNPAQSLRDNRDAYEVQDLIEVEHGRHALRAGFRFRALRDANRSSAGFNGQYIFPDVASYQAGQAEQFSISTGEQSAALLNTDVGVYAEDDWKITPNLTLSYGLRFESESGIPDHADPAPRLGFSYAVRPGKRKTPIVTLRGGYGIFYDRFPAAQLLGAIRENGTREIAYFALNTGFDPSGPPPGVVLGNTQPTTYQVDPGLRSTYQQVGSLSAARSLGRLGSVSANLLYAHTAHGFLTRNANAPLPGTFDPSRPTGGTRPLGTDANVYQFASAANGNLERFYVNYRVQLTSRLVSFGRWFADKNYNESDGIDRFPSNQYRLSQDYARAATDFAQSYSGGFLWTIPSGIQVTTFLVARSGAPFDITTGTDLNGDTIYNDRPALATDLSRSSVVRTGFGTFDVAPGAGAPVLPRNYGTAPGYLWLQLQASKDFHVGPRPNTGRSVARGSLAPAPDRPWDLRFAVEVHNLTNHNNPGLPVGVLSAQPCGTANAVFCSNVGAGGSSLAPSQNFGHSLSLAEDFSPVTASNRTILLQSSFTF